MRMKNENPKAYEKLHLKLFSISVRLFVVSLIVVSTMYIVLVTAPIIGIHINVLYEPWLLVIFIPEIVLGVLILMAKNIARNDSMSIMTIIRTKTHNRRLKPFTGQTNAPYLSFPCANR